MGLGEPLRTGGGEWLRPAEPSQGAALFEAVDASRNALAPWLPWCTARYTQASAEAFLAEATLEYRTLIFPDHDSTAVLGAASLMPVDRFDGVWKLGYWVRADAQRRGVARRAAATLCRAAFASGTVQRVSILIAVGNVPSRRVAEALGAELEGVLKSRLLLPSGRHDAALYGLVPEALAEDLRP